MSHLPSAHSIRQVDSEWQIGKMKLSDVFRQDNLTNGRENFILKPKPPTQFKDDLIDRFLKFFSRKVGTVYENIQSNRSVHLE